MAVRSKTSRRRGRSRTVPLRWAGICLVLVGALSFAVGFHLGGRTLPFLGSSSKGEGRTLLPSSLDRTAERTGERPLPSPAPPREGTRVALVMDDLGRSAEIVDALAALEIPLTYAVLPFESQTPQTVDRLRRRGAEFLCHLPMEAKNGKNPGPGALTSTMSREELVRRTEAALAAVPGAVGVNNHMGSGFSSHAPAIRQVLRVLAAHGLFYLDSRTSVDSLGYATALALGIPAAERHVFLDRDPHPPAIRHQFWRLLDVARERGAAVAIGHPYAATLDVLRAEVPKARDQGFQFVRVSAILDRPSGELPVASHRLPVDDSGT